MKYCEVCKKREFTYFYFYLQAFINQGKYKLGDYKLISAKEKYKDFDLLICKYCTKYRQDSIIIPKYIPKEQYKKWLITYLQK